MLSVTVNRRPNTTCVLCSTPMYRRPKQLAMGRRFCSRRCRNKVHGYGGQTGQMPPKPKPRYGPANPAWKGGVTYFKTHGNYVGVKYVRSPEWAIPMARKDHYIMEHRLVMAQWMGRLLTRTEVVNHLDHNPANNQRLNLELWPTNGDHKRGEVGRAVIGVANRRFLTDLERL